MGEKIEKKIVVPGEKLGSATRFMPGNNVTVAKQKIYSMVFGEMSVDKEKRLSVLPLREITFPIEGDLALGIVYNTTEVLVYVRLVCAIRKNKVVPYNGVTTGVIHKLQTGIPGDPRQIFGLGDIVLARVLSTSIVPFPLSTRDPELGIVAGYCNQCGTSLQRKGDQLFCPTCEKPVKKKMSTLYDYERFKSFFLQYYERKEIYVR